MEAMGLGSQGQETMVVALERPGWFTSNHHGSCAPTTMVFHGQPPWSFTRRHPHPGGRRRHSCFPFCSSLVSRYKILHDYTIPSAKSDTPSTDICGFAIPPAPRPHCYSLFVNANGSCGENRSQSGLSQFVITSPSSAFVSSSPTGSAPMDAPRRVCPL